MRWCEPPALSLTSPMTGPGSNLKSPASQPMLWPCRHLAHSLLGLFGLEHAHQTELVVPRVFLGWWVLGETLASTPYPYSHPQAVGSPPSRRC